MSARLAVDPVLIFAAFAAGLIVADVAHRSQQAAIVRTLEACQATSALQDAAILRAGTAIDQAGPLCGALVALRPRGRR